MRRSSLWWTDRRNLSDHAKSISQRKTDFLQSDSVSAIDSIEQGTDDASCRTLRRGVRASSTTSLSVGCFYQSDPSNRSLQSDCRARRRKWKRRSRTTTIPKTHRLKVCL